LHAKAHDAPHVAADAFRDFWPGKDTVDLQAPEDPMAENVAALANASTQ